MATKNTADADKAAENTVAKQVYSIEELKQNAFALFGVQAEVLDGALYGNTKAEFTINEMKGLVDKFLKRAVK